MIGVIAYISQFKKKNRKKPSTGVSALEAFSNFLTSYFQPAPITTRKTIITHLSLTKCSLGSFLSPFMNIKTFTSNCGMKCFTP